jgi:hypothetical protein
MDPPSTLLARSIGGWYQSMALPITGSVERLELLSPFIADDHINQVLPRHRGAGRPSQWSGAQLYRTLLLMLLTPSTIKQFALQPFARSTRLATLCPFAQP